ncbi:MAG: type sorting protein [Fibrobacteres bacterium]|nr:type sorting protein [Fibrobacterota bacterium]
MIPSHDFSARALLTAVLLAGPLSTQAQTYRVNCGGETFADKSGHLWEGDGHFEGGMTFSASSDILNTDIPNLYQTERWNDPGQGGLKYTFNVLPGDYRVNLHFAEIYDSSFATGKRVFDVLLNGMAVAADLDIFAQAGANTPLILDYLATAVDGKITVEFGNKIGNAKVAGIEVIPQAPFHATAAPYRIHCGGDDYIDPQGNYWEADGHATNGYTYLTSNPVTNTDKSWLYQSERWNSADIGDMTYAFDVAEGSYTVKLHFAEIFFQAAGARTFSVDLNGLSVIQDLDIAAEAGPNAALVKEFTAQAQEGKITLAFHNGLQNAKIAGIEILPADPVGNRPLKALAAASGAQVRSPGAGSLSVRWPGPERYTVSVKDSRGREIGRLSGTGNGEQSVTGLRPGLYMEEVRAGARSLGYRVPVL